MADRIRPTAVIVDVDGTLVDVSSVRHHVTGKKRNFDKFHADSAHCPPITQTLDWCADMVAAGHLIVVVTARMGKWRDLTQAWIDKHLPHPIARLVMRTDGDFRPDFDVKRDIHADLAKDFDIVHACDDNPNVIRLWDDLGIPVTVIPGWPG